MFDVLSSPGRDLREWDPQTLKSRCGAIFQDFVRYELTVGENVGVPWFLRSEKHPVNGCEIRSASWQMVYPMIHHDSMGVQPSKEDVATIHRSSKGK